VTPIQRDLGGTPDGVREQSPRAGAPRSLRLSRDGGAVVCFAWRRFADAAAADHMRMRCSLCRLSESTTAHAFESCFPCPESTLLARLASWCLCLCLARGAPAFDSPPVSNSDRTPKVRASPFSRGPPMPTWYCSRGGFKRKLDAGLRGEGTWAKF